METEDNSIVEVCGKIFDIVEQNMHADGGSLGLTRELFFGTMGETEEEVDLTPVRDASNYRFFKYVFRSIFGDDPVPAVVEHWGDAIWRLSRDDFRRRFLGVLKTILKADGRNVTFKE